MEENNNSNNNSNSTAKNRGNNENRNQTSSNQGNIGGNGNNGNGGGAPALPSAPSGINSSPALPSAGGTGNDLAASGGAAAGEAAGAATDVATGGLSAPIRKALQLAYAGAKEANNAANDLTYNNGEEAYENGKQRKPSIILILSAAIVAVIMFFIILISSTFLYLIPGAVTLFAGDQAIIMQNDGVERDSRIDAVYEVKTEHPLTQRVKSFFSNILSLFGGKKEETVEETLPAYDLGNRYYDGSKEMIKVIKDGFEKAKAAADTEAKAYIKSQSSSVSEYCESHSESNWETAKATDIYADVNFAEFMCVLNLSEKFNYDEASKDALTALFDDAENLKHLYRLNPGSGTCEHTKTDDDGDEETYTLNNTTFQYRRYYLNDLFEFVGLDPNGVYYPFKDYKGDLKAPTNLEMLEKMEMTLRSYGTLTSDTDFFGPNVRSDYDGGYGGNGTSYGDYFANGSTGNVTFSVLSGLNSTETAVLTDVFNAMKQAGFSDAMASGACGNIQQESSFHPACVSKSGTYHGLVQWGDSKGSGYRWQKVESYAAEHGLMATSAEAQIGFIRDVEIPSYKSKMNSYLAKYVGSGADVSNVTNVELATEAWCVMVEGCTGGSDLASNGKKYQDLNNRKKYAKNIFSSMIVSSGNVSFDFTYDSEAAELFINNGSSKVGKPYVWGAKGPNSFDCSGFVYWVLNSSGVSTEYRRAKAWSGNIPGFQKITDISQGKPGDIIVESAWGNDSNTWHAGFLAPDNTFLNASSGDGKIKFSKRAGREGHFVCYQRYIGK